MQLDILGSAGSYPSPIASCSSYVIKNEDTTLLFDLGNGSLGKLYQYLEPQSLDAIIVTHGHYDHFSDLVGLYHYLKYATKAAPPIPLLGTEDFAAKFYYLVGDQAKSDGIFLFIPAEVNSQIKIGSLSLSFLFANHPIPTLISRVSDGKSTMCYGSDGDSCIELLEAANDVDLFLGESTWLNRDNNHPDGIHMDASTLAEVANKASCKLLIVTHIAYPTDPSAVLDVVKTKFKGNVQLAVDGDSINF